MKNKQYSFQPIQRQTTFQNDSELVYFCGCNQLLSDKDKFKQHVLQIHDGQFVQGSSHYLSLVTLIVLPVKLWRKQNVQTVFDQPQPNLKVSHMTLIKEREVAIQNKPFNEVLQASKGYAEGIQKRGRGRPKRIKKQVNKQASKKPIKWNRFLLVPNPLTINSGFFCGKCKKQFFSTQHFVQHCIYQCQELQNPLSSHSIEEINKDRVHQSPPIQAIAINPQTPLSALEILRNSIFQRLSNEDKQFVCGCGYSGLAVRRQQNIMGHVKQAHQEVLPSNSSHVILTRKKYLYEKKDNCKFRQFRKSYGILKIGGLDDGDWYCPCNPQRIMKKQNFIVHILRVHFGISPPYIK